MTCPLCGYAMTALDKECPRCHGRGLGEARPAAPSGASAPSHLIAPSSGGPRPVAPGPQSFPQADKPAAAKLTAKQKRTMLLGAGGMLFLYLFILSRLGANSEVKPVVVNGPSFAEVDARMDDRRGSLTDAQKNAYWDSVAETTIHWNGQIIQASADGSGSLLLKCNPNSVFNDTSLDLDGTQKALIPTLNKDQVISFTATLHGHGMTGYYLENGHIDEAKE